MKISNIEKEFRRIKSLGFIKSKRSHNTGIGKTFEDYLGVNENNIKDPDFEGFEVKSQRYLTSSKITLFTKSPTYPQNANYYIKDKYGVFDTTCNKIKKIHTSFFGDRENTYLRKYSFKLNIDRKKKKIFFIIKDLLNKKILNSNIHYTFNDIIDSTKKLDKLFVVTADTKVKRGKEYFHFKNATLFIGFNFDKFLNLIEQGKIQYDIRIGAYRSGQNKCKPHDHGSGFRIDRDSIKALYKTVIELD